MASDEESEAEVEDVELEEVEENELLDESSWGDWMG